MKFKPLLLAAMALASMAGGAILYQLLDKPHGAAPGARQAPPALHSIPLTGLDGAESVLSDWRGEILVVNFWAPWCAPCRREIPGLIDIRREYASRGVRVLGIAFDNKAQVLRFADDYGIDYPLFLSENRSAMYNAAFGNRSGSLPFTAMLDRDLRIRFEHNGELSRQQISEQLELLL